MIGHPNLGKVVSVDKTDDSVVFFACESLKGSTLRELFDRGDKFSTQQSVGIALQILCALHSLHKREMMHGYLHPNAIFVVPGEGEKLTVKLRDFAILDLQDYLGDSRIVRNYLSPEPCRDACLTHSQEKVLQS